MKNLVFLIVLLFTVGCKQKVAINPSPRTDFSQEEKAIMKAARDIIKQCYFGTLITLDETGQPRARIMEPFEPNEHFEIWLATNPKSRKVTQIKYNPAATMYYFDKMNMGYVSLMGSAYLVNDNAIKNEKWKDGWERFYKNREKDYLLIHFIPKTLELISIPNGFTGDSINWKPHLVKLQ